MAATHVQGPAVHVHHLEKSYQQLHVLRGVDFEIARGTIFALLGSNGAGKTTIVNILATLLRADAGTASVNGHDVASQAAEVRASISLTGQFAAVDEVLTGREREVLEQIGLGLTNAEIAGHLHMSEATVKSHVTHLFEKLSATNRVQLAMAAFRAGLVE